MSDFSKKAAAMWSRTGVRYCVSIMPEHEQFAPPAEMKTPLQWVDGG